MMSKQEIQIPLWLDCDPGHDDAFAILLAAYHPNITLLGISTVHGNAPLSHTTENAGRILTAIGKPHISIYPGAAEGLVRPAVHAGSIHGESGLDGTDLLPAPAVPAVRGVSAVEAIAKALLDSPPNTAWLIATGALTNVAQLFSTHPSLASHIAGFSVMGGAVGGNFTAAPLGLVGSTERFGNWTPFAEFNVVVDPEAAASVFSNEVLAKKTVLIPLDVTHLVLATGNVQALLLNGKAGGGHGRIGETPTTMRIMLVELLTFFAKTYAEVFGIVDGPPLHDPLAVAVCLDGILGVEVPFYDFKTSMPTSGKTEAEQGRETVGKERFKVSVVTDGTHEEALRGEKETGRTVVELLPEGVEGIKIPRGLDVKRFWGLLEDCLTRADMVNMTEASKTTNE